MTFHRRALLAALFTPLLASLAPPAMAAEPASDARIVYDVLYGDGGFRVGRAEQHWHVSAGHYELRTEIIPLLGPRIRYVSKGRVASDEGLVPESFAEFRSSEETPRAKAEFDWPARQLHYGPNDEPEHTEPLKPGAQDVNALAFQLGWLGEKVPSSMQVTTGKRVSLRHFTGLPRTQATVNGQAVPAVAWRAGEGRDRTEIWLAPSLGNLPVKVVRVDDDKQLQLVAREVQFSPARGKD